MVFLFASTLEEGSKEGCLSATGLLGCDKAGDDIASTLLGVPPLPLDGLSVSAVDIVLPSLAAFTAKCFEGLWRVEDDEFEGKLRFGVVETDFEDGDWGPR